MKVKTLEQARRFVISQRICTVFAGTCKTLKSLWGAVDLPDKGPGESGWGDKISAVWTWKNELPAHYPQEIFYGKIKGGSAVLMTLDYLRDCHYPKYHQDIRNCSPLAGHIYELIQQERYETTALRRDSIEQFGCTKSQFDAALKELQVTLNIVRSNEPGIERDTWLPFKELYLGIYRKYHAEP
jgi:hypothetical protein